MCKRTLKDVEIWTYNPVGRQARSTNHYIFYRRAPKTPRILYTIGTADGEVFAPGSCRKTFEELGFECQGMARQGDPCIGSVCTDACGVYQAYVEIKNRQASR